MKISKKYKSIRLKVLAVLLSLLIIYGFTTILNLIYNKQKDKIVQFNTTVKTVQILLLKDAITVNDFFMFEPNNKIYFTTGNSFYIEEHRIYMSGIKSQINLLLTSDVISSFGLESQLSEVYKKLDAYDNYFNYIASYIKQRGYNNSEDNPENTTDKSLQNRENKAGDKKLSAKIIELKEQLNNEKIAILNNISRISDNAKNRRKVMSEELQYFFEICAFLVLVVGIIVSLFLSKQATRRIISLSDIITRFINSKFTHNEEISIKKHSDEIGQLVDNFLILRKEVWNQINFLEDNIKKRTEQILSQNNKIKEQNEEISAQRDEVMKKSILIQKQNSNILDSIKYAKKIQEAFLPERKIIKNVFPDCFILWKPKALVSGDFYWFKNVSNKNENISFLAAVDCTGHGVPGAFMSMLGNSLLNEIILRKKNKNAGIILNLLRDQLIETLRLEGNRAKANDGMDIALVVFNHNTNTIQYAGAKRPLYIIRNGEITVMQPDKMPIGSFVNEKMVFTEKYIHIEPNDSLYIFSDGFTDQFGGIKNRKFMSKHFQEMLLGHYTEPMETQEIIYESVFENWKGKREQTDDVLLIGVRMRSGENIISQSYAGATSYAV